MEKLCEGFKILLEQLFINSKELQGHVAKVFTLKPPTIAQIKEKDNDDLKPSLFDKIDLKDLVLIEMFD